jgi:hypothetical protein
MRKTILCPICEATKLFSFPKELIEKRNGMDREIVAVLIPKEVVCKHRFLIYLDKNFDIRHTLPVDKLYNFKDPKKYKLDPVILW